MSLVDMKSLLTKAKQGNYGIGAFSVGNMEMILGAVKAAEESRSPAILQIAQARLPYSPLKLIGPMMIAAAENASVPIAVHFDHGTDPAVIRQALELGFTSVMIDASHLKLSENIRMVKQVKDMADQYKASVEAEVGQLGKSEDGSEDTGMFYSNPNEVKELYESTGADAIALSIGNAHGLYTQEPKLNFNILADTGKLVSVPLVLHGGSGISAQDFKKCIQYGIRKVNIATASFMAVEAAARKYAAEEKKDYFKLSAEMVNSVCQNVKEHIEIFGSNNKV